MVHGIFHPYRQWNIFILKNWSFKLLLSWWPQPFQLGPEKMGYLILCQNLQILSFTKETYEKIFKWSRKWQPEKYKIVQSKKHIDLNICNAFYKLKLQNFRGTFMEKKPSTKFSVALIIFQEVMNLQSLQSDVSDVIPTNVLNISRLFFAYFC